MVRGVGARIAEAAEGNPLFVEEMLSMLIDDGLLVREGGRWTAAGDISTVRVPPTIHALLAARLDQLDGSERAVIERASVIGKVFQEGAIAELSSAVAPSVAESLGALVRKDLIRPERVSLGDRTYRFRHLLIRDAAYESIPKEVRSELHERFGRWLERTTGERAIEYEEVVGYHLEQAYRYRGELGAVDDAARALAREAAERLGSAGRRAFIRSDAPAGMNLIARAAALLPPDDPLRVELVPNVRVVQGLGGDMRWADRVLTEAVEAAATTGNRRTRRPCTRPTWPPAPVHRTRRYGRRADRCRRPVNRRLRGDRRRTRPGPSVAAEGPGPLPGPPSRCVRGSFRTSIRTRSADG